MTVSSRQPMLLKAFARTIARRFTTNRQFATFLIRYSSVKFAWQRFAIELDLLCAAIRSLITSNQFDAHIERNKILLVRSLRGAALSKALPSNSNYFILSCSYGDKWCILSFIHNHFDLYGNSMVLASRDDRRLVEIFVGPKCSSERFVYLESSEIIKLSSLFRPISKNTSQLADAFSLPELKHTLQPYFQKYGLPPGTLRPLHFIYYPYMADLHNVHGVSYGTLMKTILYLPSTSQSREPSFYSSEDINEARALLSDENMPKTEKRFILINAVNFSQQSLEIEQIHLLANRVQQYGYAAFVNVAMSPELDPYRVLEYSGQFMRIVRIPSHLMALICAQAYAVIGALGGAMNIAVQFSDANVLSLQTNNIGHGISDDHLLGRWSRERIWQPFEEEWPRLPKTRITRNIFVGEPRNLANSSLLEILDTFMRSLNGINDGSLQDS